MYFVPIIVPIFIDGDRRLVHSDWRRAVRLLRDSLGGRYGELVLAAPFLPVSDTAACEQELAGFEEDEDIELLPVYDGRIRAREFWARELPRLHHRFEPLLDRASVVHSGLGDLHKPVMELPFASALRRGIPTVFVQDTDTVTQIREGAHDADLRARLKTEGYTWLYERTCRASVAHADLSLLKGKELMQRYQRYAKNAREFHNTSYLSSEVASATVLEHRFATLHEGRPLRLVYCGRLVERKGVQDSIRIVHEAKQRGANVTFDIIGHGPSEPGLRVQVERAGLGQTVRFLGSRHYDAALLKELVAYDAILFSPTIEDTPRMIFDGYAAGLPLLGVEIPYVRERADEEGATLLLPRADVGAAAERLVELDRQRDALIGLSRKALEAGLHHAADNWYRRRAEWTHEAVERKVRPARPPRPGPRPIAAHAPL